MVEAVPDTHGTGGAVYTSFLLIYFVATSFGFISFKYRQ